MSYFENIETPNDQECKDLSKDGWVFHKVLQKTRHFAEGQITTTNKKYAVHYPIAIADAHQYLPKDEVKIEKRS